jgi:hypothetical protein
MSACNIYLHSSFTRVRTAVARQLKSPPSLLYAFNNSKAAGRILIKFGIGVSYEHVSSHVSVYLDPTNLTTTLHEDVYAFMYATLAELAAW